MSKTGGDRRCSCLMVLGARRDCPVHGWTTGAPDVTWPIPLPGGKAARLVVPASMSVEDYDHMTLVVSTLLDLSRTPITASHHDSESNLKESS